MSYNHLSSTNHYAHKCDSLAVAAAAKAVSTTTCLPTNENKKGLILVVHVVLVVTTVCRRTGRNYTCYKLPILHLHPLIPIYNYCWQRNKVWTQATHAAATSKMWELGLVLVLELGSVRAWARLIGWQRRPSLGRGRCRSLGWCRCGSMGRCGCRRESWLIGWQWRRMCGAAVGPGVGAWVGAGVGARVGTWVGDGVGLVVGAGVGDGVGDAVG